MRVLNGIEDLEAAVGDELGVSAWQDVTQERIDDFARVTGDHQWIHVDVERAKASPFGGTIAHGYYTLSLAPKLSNEQYRIDGFAFTVNYGVNRVRFPAPMPVGGRMRMRSTLTSVEALPDSVQIVITQTFEREGGAKPVCVVESLARLFPSTRRL